MTSLPAETVAYGVVAAISIALLAGGVRDRLRMERAPRATVMLLGLTTSLVVSAIAVFFAAYIRWVNAGVLPPEQGVALRAGVEGGIVGGLLSVWWWRFR